jgi:uncharacterized protein involved in exopolysaccharide biosynthesis
VIEKFLDAFFRHKLLILLPPIIIPLIVTPIAFLLAPTYYEAYASIWVSRPTYLSYSNDSNPYITPAQEQSGRLGEQVKTRAFLRDIARRAPLLAPFANFERGEQFLQQIVGTGLAMFPSGTNLLVLRFRSDNPELSYQALNAVIEAYNDKAAGDRIGQGGLASGFYESRVKAAEDQLAKANEELRRYVAANPRLTSIDPARGASATTASRLGLPAMAIDPELAELLRRVESAQRDAGRARESLDKTELDVAASLEGLEQGFQVVDAPTRPTTPTQERRKLLVFPAAALLVGLGLGVSLLVLLVVADRSVRSATDLAPTVRVVSVVPLLRLKRLPKRAGADTTRQAIGFVAGTALPPPRGAQ